MRDGYFYRSLLGTAAGYVVCTASLMAFVLTTGIVGFSILVLVVTVLLVYFYGGFKRLCGISAKGSPRRGTESP